MPNYLEDYKTYYRLRMQRYENNPDYKNSYESEKAIYEAIASCNVLEEFKNKPGNLNEKNAVALIVDEYNIRLKHYNEIKEPIRAEGCIRIIEKAKTIDKVAELITMVGEEENKTMLAITADSISPFDDAGYLERIELGEKAEVPDKYKASYLQYANEEKQNLVNTYNNTEKNLNNWEPGWKFNFDRIWEERHRRLLPFPDATIQDNILKIKNIRDAH